MRNIMDVKLDLQTALQMPTFDEVTVTNDCGCTTDISISGSLEEREEQVKTEKAKICFWCNVRLLNVKAIENSKLKGYAKLVGPKNRVRWALNIRDSADLDLPPDHPIFTDVTLQPFAATVQSLRKRLVDIVDAEWWITHRRSFAAKSLLDHTNRVLVKSKKFATIIKNIDKIANLSNDW